MIWTFRENQGIVLAYRDPSKKDICCEYKLYGLTLDQYYKWFQHNNMKAYIVPGHRIMNTLTHLCFEIQSRLINSVERFISISFAHWPLDKLIAFPEL